MFYSNHVPGLPPSPPQEASHDHLMHRRALRDAQTPAKLKRNRSLAANSQLSMEEKKRKIIRNLWRLESLGLVDSAHQYQELINEMAKVCLGVGGD